MATDPQTLTIEPAEWDSRAEALLIDAAPFDTLAQIRAQVIEGPAVLFHVRHQAATVGAFVLRVDHTATGNEGVIVAGAGNVPGVDLIASVMPSIETLFQGCARIRYHTHRPALARRLARLGYQAREIVSFKEINHAQPVTA